MKNYLRQNKAITLIALVITIIVLLILAGITIASLTGDNGLLARAAVAKGNTERAEVIEKVRLQIIGKIAGNNGKDLDEDGIKDVLKDFFKEDSIPEELTDMTATLTTKDEKFNDITLGEVIGDVTIAAGSPKLTVTKNGTEVKLSSVSDSEISTYYGAETSYKSTSHPNIKWQLFLTDASNYYLIASDYVPTNELPCDGNTMNGVTYGNTDLQAVNNIISDSNFKARFSSSISYNDYVMTSSVHNSGTESTAITRNPLTSTYLQWVKYASDNNYTKDNANMKAVAYMMDTSKWQSFADGADGAYAIGGPTVEMLSLSWNVVSGHRQMTSYEALSSSNANINGYSTSGPESKRNFFGSSTNMWVIKESTKAGAYWLASPGWDRWAQSCGRGIYWVRWEQRGGQRQLWIPPHGCNSEILNPDIEIPKGLSK